MVLRLIYGAAAMLLMAAVFAIGLIAIAVFSTADFRGPSESEVLQGSGLDFLKSPRLTRNTTTQSGPGGSDVQVIMEFDLDSTDITRFADCNMSDYHRDSPHAGRFLVMGMFSRQASSLEQACWRFFNKDGDHVYVLFQSKLFYQLLIY